MTFRRSLLMKILALTASSTMVFLSTALFLSAAHAQSVTYGIDYAGFNVGAATMTIEEGAKDYSFAVNGKFSSLVASGSFSAASSGKISKSGLAPNRYGLNVSGEEPQKTDIVFTKGRASSITISPEESAERKAQRVPLKPEHLRNVLDPASAIFSLVIKKGSEAEAAICQGSFEVFTGTVRAKLTLSPAGDTPVQILCKVKFSPVAGHRNSSSTRRLMASEEIRVGFSRNLDGKLRFPQSVTVPLRVGKLTLTRKG
jgi:hypothetical protein